jgi:NADH-quinone oxidoreductase subunit L
MLGAALLALVSDDLKRVLAWSTVSQLAYMFAAIAVGDPDAATAHLVAHGVFKALLFLSAGCVAHAVGSTALSAAGGLRRRLPVTAWTSAVGFAALAGVVPTSGFFTKDAVLDAGLGAVDGSGPVAGWVAVVVVAAGLATVVVTAAYALRTWWRVFLGPVPDVATAGRRDEPVAMSAPLVLLAVGVLAYSLTQEPHLLTGVVTTVLVLAAAAVTVPVLRRGADPADLLGPVAPALRTEGGFERLNDAIGAGVGRVAAVVVALDHQVVDAYPRGVAATARAGARLSDRAVTGNVQTYATVLAAGVAVAVLVMAVVVR